MTIVLPEVNVVLSVAQLSSWLHLFQEQLEEESENKHERMSKIEEQEPCRSREERRAETASMKPESNHGNKCAEQTGSLSFFKCLES